MDQEIRDALGRILARPRGRRLLVEREGMQAVDFSPENFHPLTPSEMHDVLCIDGGQATLFETAEVLAGIVRVACVRARGTRTEVVARRQWHAIVHTAVSSGTLAYEARLLGPGRKTFTINPNEAALRDGLSRAGLGKALEVVRRCLELDIAREMLSAAQGSTIVALDGELDAKAALEKEALAMLLQTAQEKKVTVLGVVKSSTLITDQGASLAAFLAQASPPGRWRYWPLIRTQDIDWVMVRLAGGNAGVYRVDVPAHMPRQDIEAALASVCSAAQDISLPGYPYGLVVADQFARVSGQEAAQLKAEMMAQLTKESFPGMQGEDTHDVLNRIVHKMSRTY